MSGFKVSPKTIKALGPLFTGDPTKGGNPVMPYRKGWQIQELFEPFGCAGPGGSLSRWQLAEELLAQANTGGKLTDALGTLLHDREFVAGAFDLTAALQHANRHLAFDGMRLVRAGQTYKLARLDARQVEVRGPLDIASDEGRAFIDEQLAKCDRKIGEEDFDGAVTNARSVLEAVLGAVEAKLVDRPEPHDGDLVKLFRSVQKLLHLEPQRKDINDALRQVLSGLTSIVSGLAPLRNKMSDAHARTFRPARHHAKLAVNAAKTAVDFVLETFDYQLRRGTITTNGQGTAGQRAPSARAD
ncbi:MAG: abortive infection family protein [Polyangiaceae bacterium]|jgi:hypothetical protein